MTVIVVAQDEWSPKPEVAQDRFYCIAKQIAFRDERGHLVFLGGQTFISLVKLSNVWTDWHQHWFTSADSSGNGHRLNTSRPTIPQGAFWGVLEGHKFKCLGKLSNCPTDWHQIWYMPADSFGNGHSSIQFVPQYHRGHWGGGGGG